MDYTYATKNDGEIKPSLKLLLQKKKIKHATKITETLLYAYHQTKYL